MAFSFHSAGLTRALFAALVVTAAAAPQVAAQRQMERLDRGVVAVPREEGGAFVSWRLLAQDPEGIAFNVYRSSGGGGEGEKLNPEPIADVTHFTDSSLAAGQAATYMVLPVVDGREAEGEGSFTLNPTRPYLSIPLQTPEGYTPNDASVGDLDGDGAYELVIHQVGRGRDNSQNGVTTEPVIEAYELDGTLLWRINLGRNIREGAHYTQFMVYDLDGDGRAEVAMKTADGTVDGLGKVIGDTAADHRNEQGHVLAGPEFLTIFDGMTGGALATAPYIPPRHPHEGRPDAGGAAGDMGGRARQPLRPLSRRGGLPGRRAAEPGDGPRLLHPLRPRRLELSQRPAHQRMDLRQRRRHAGERSIPGSGEPQPERGRRGRGRA